MTKTTAVPILVPVDSTLAYTADSGWHLLPMPPSWWVDERLADNLDDDPIPYLPGYPDVDAPIPFWPVEIDDELNAECGHHCGIDGSPGGPAREGHCGCPECHGATVDLNGHDAPLAVAR
jgi:hypothetical protein